jgi:hypothetical protein
MLDRKYVGDANSQNTHPFVFLSVEERKKHRVDLNSDGIHEGEERSPRRKGDRGKR